MPTFWDTLPASAWPTQPFIPPIDPTQVFAMGAPTDWIASPVSAPAPAQMAVPASADADAGKSADASATSSTDSSGGILGQYFAPLWAPTSAAARAAAEAPKLPPWLLPLGLTGAAATTALLASTTRTARPEDDEFHPQYVVRGGLWSPRSLQDNTKELTEVGLPGQYGMSSTSAPNMSVDQLAAVARYPNAQLSYTIVPELNGLGYRVEPTPRPLTNPLHASILLPPGEPELTDAQAATLSALFGQHIIPNPYQTPRR